MKSLEEEAAQCLLLGRGGLVVSQLLVTCRCGNAWTVLLACLQQPCDFYFCLPGASNKKPQ